jgi:multisubunit Na+/H+ antiporter MnhB subunit
MYGLMVGVAGMILILLAFILNVFQRLGSHTTEFLVLNLVGSVLLLAYAAMLPSPPFLVLNAVWSAVALWGLLHHGKR